MKTKSIPVILICMLVALSSYATDDLPKAFTDLLERAQMTFVVPDGYVDTELVENNHMLYEYAVKHPTEKFEIRYAIRPIDDMLKDYEEWKANPQEGVVKVDPRGLYPAIAAAVGFNIAEKMSNGGQPFPEESVKNEFGADAGMHIMVEPREAFSNGYKHCMMVAINKAEQGTAFIFYMFDDPNTFARLAMPVFYKLRFE